NRRREGEGPRRPSGGDYPHRAPQGERKGLEGRSRAGAQRNGLRNGLDGRGRAGGDDSPIRPGGRRGAVSAVTTAISRLAIITEFAPNRRQIPPLSPDLPGNFGTRVARRGAPPSRRGRAEEPCHALDWVRRDRVCGEAQPVIEEARGFH